jgi:hypothetical protein
MQLAYSREAWGRLLKQVLFTFFVSYFQFVASLNWGRDYEDTYPEMQNYLLHTRIG